MQITYQKQPKCLGRIDVVAPSETVSAERERLIKAFSKEAKVKGYRPGKIPRAVIEKMFAKGISEELDGRLINKAIDDAIREHNLAVLDVKTPQEVTHQADGTFTFHLELVLAPDIDLPDYKGLEIEVPMALVKDEDIEQEIEKIRHQLADFQEISDRGLQMGDLAIIDYKTTHEGQPLEEISEKAAGALAGKEGYWIKMDSESFLPGFCDQLVGLKSSETLTVQSTVPDDFPLTELHNKPLDIEVTLQQIKEEVLPEINDELAEKILPGKSLEELRDLIREEIQKQAERRTEDAKADQVVQNLIEKADFELPEELVLKETQNQADKIVSQGTEQGVSAEELEAQQSALFAEATNRATSSLKSTFLLQKVAETEEIEVPQPELLERINLMAQHAKKSPKAYIKELQKGDRIRGIHHSMLISKTIDFLISEAKITEVEAGEEVAA